MKQSATNEMKHKFFCFSVKRKRKKKENLSTHKTTNNVITLFAYRHMDECEGNEYKQK